MDPRGRRFLIIGDSHSDGARTPGGRLAAELRARGAADVRINARSGRSAVSLWSTPADVQALATEAARRPDVVIVFLGTNDIGYPVASDEAAFRKIAAAFPGAGQLAIGPPSFPNRPDLDAGAPKVYGTLARVFGPGNVIDARPLGAADSGYHFSAARALVFARAIADVIAPVPAGAPDAVSSALTAPRWRWTIGSAGLALIGIAAALVIRRRRALAGPGRTWLSARGARHVADEIDTPRGRRLVIHSADGGLPELLAPEALDREIKLDEARAASAARQQASHAEAAAAATSKAAREIGVQAFSSNPKVRAALLQVQGFNGKLMPRHAYVEAAVEAGAQVVPAAGGRRLVSPNGAFFTERDITKSAMDYAVWLRTQRGELAGPNAHALSDEEREHVHSPIRGEIDEAVERAVAAGAQAPLAYMGAGAEGVVFCDPTGKAFKVGRHMGRGDTSLETEAAFFCKANQVPAIARNVARFYRYDRDQDVIVRECIRTERTKKGDRRYMPNADTKAWDTAERIHRAMLPFGFTGPERKPDSFVYVRGRGMVLVDGGFAHKVGHELVKDVLAKKAGRIPRGPFEDDEALASHVRWERDRTIPKAIADRVRAKLGDNEPLAAPRVEMIEDAHEWADIDPELTVRKWVVEDEDAIDGVELRSREREGVYAIAHRTTKPHADDKWQVSWFDDAGAVGDIRESTLVAALTEGASPYEYDVAAVHTKAARQRLRGVHRRRERIPGGLAPGGRCPAGTDPAELRRGIAVELEHTNDRGVAREIACDHLTEDRRYYRKLAAIETA